MDIYFVGGVYTSKEQQEEVLKKSKGMVQFAANEMQWNFINGLDLLNDEPVKILNSTLVGLYPKSYSDAFIRGYSWAHSPGAKDYNVGYLNILIFKHITRCFGLIRKAVKWAKDKRFKQKVMIVYSLHSPFLVAAFAAKMINRKVKICLIVPDLPQFMDMSIKRGLVYSTFKKFDERLINHLVKLSDCFVLLTKQMVDVLNVRNKPFTIIEGMVNPNEIAKQKEQDDKKQDENIVLYTGTLHRKYGILTLLDAFSLIKEPNYRLWICGKGDAEDEVKIAQEKDNRIEYYGQLSRREIIMMQSHSTVLINPRSSSDDFTKYSFPSKTMEYMLSGSPVIMHKLPGIPDEYRPYIVWIRNESPQGMAESIINTCNMDMDKLREFGLKAQQFVIKEKTFEVQCGRLY